MNYISHSCGVYRYKDIHGNTYKSNDLVVIVRDLMQAGFTVQLDTMVDVITGERKLLYVVNEHFHKPQQSYFVCVAATMNRRNRLDNNLPDETLGKECSFVYHTNETSMDQLYTDIQNDETVMKEMELFFVQYGARNDPYFFIRNISKLS